MAQKPIAKEVAHRFAELVGSGFTQHEAAWAVEIGTRHMEEAAATGAYAPLLEMLAVPFRATVIKQLP